MWWKKYIKNKYTLKKYSKNDLLHDDYLIYIYGKYTIRHTNYFYNIFVNKFWIKLIFLIIILTYFILHLFPSLKHFTCILHQVLDADAVKNMDSFSIQFCSTIVCNYYCKVGLLGPTTWKKGLKSVLDLRWALWSSGYAWPESANSI